jgi:hypothetical protein
MTSSDLPAAPGEPLRTRYRGEPVDVDAIRDSVMKRTSKARAYLAKHETPPPDLRLPGESGETG